MIENMTNMYDSFNVLTNRPIIMVDNATLFTYGSILITTTVLAVATIYDEGVDDDDEDVDDDDEPNNTSNQMSDSTNEISPSTNEMSPFSTNQQEEVEPEREEEEKEREEETNQNVGGKKHKKRKRTIKKHNKRKN